MLTYADRVKETTTTTGTGTLTLAGAVPGYQSFTAALTTGALVTYGLLNGNAWEVGQGTFTTSGLTLSRTLIASSTGSLLSLSGTSTVFLTVAARDAANLASPPGNWAQPTGTIAETFPRQANGSSGVLLTAGQLFLNLCWMPAGAVVNTIAFASASPGLTLGTSPHLWFAIYDHALNLLAQTTDDTAATWGTNAVHAEPLAAPLTLTYTGLYYVGICIAQTGGTLPNAAYTSAASDNSGVPPVLCGNSTAALAGVAPATAAAIGNDYRFLYARVY